jgi:hypothetical protein
VNIEHAETFSMFLIEMFVMHFMRPPDRPNIGVPAPGKPFKALMYDHIVNQEICEAVCHDAEADSLQPPFLIHGTICDTEHAWYSEYHKEEIILFKKTRLHLVMIPMEIPEKAMHNPPMGAPGNAFHDHKCPQQY